MVPADVAFIIVATALVLLMTPALAFSCRWVCSA
jgi:ammonia channel protein AmtB